MLKFVDTHTHLDEKSFEADIDEVMSRARQAGVAAVFVPGIDLNSVETVMALCRRYAGYAYPMIGLQPEEVKEDWEQVLQTMYKVLKDNLEKADGTPLKYIAVGEVGLDFYWTREHEREQLKVFERQVEWSIETRLPLMIHCRTAQNEMMHVLRPLAKELPGGVFHCFTGNTHEAETFLTLDRFYLGIGGVSTFKSSHLREDLPLSAPLSRIVLETDSPYMAPVPHRGKRNESAFVVHVLNGLAEAYGVTPEQVAESTNANVQRIFGVTV